MAETAMDERDSRLFIELRERFPLVERPFEEIGRKLGMSEDEVIRRTKALIGKGVIRRIGYMPGERLRHGRVSSLVGMKVRPEEVEAAAAAVSRQRNVSHNYLRDHDLNLWFTLSAQDRDALAKDLQGLVETIRPEDWVSLPASRMFKLSAPAGTGGGCREETI